MHIGVCVGGGVVEFEDAGRVICFGSERWAFARGYLGGKLYFF